MKPMGAMKLSLDCQKQEAEFLIGSIYYFSDEVTIFPNKTKTRVDTKLEFSLRVVYDNKQSKYGSHLLPQIHTFRSG